MSHTKFKVTAIAAGVAMALGTAPATFAQDDEIEEIVVTGSHIRRTEFEGRAPIQIVNAEAISLNGAAQVVEVLKELTVNSGSQMYGETNSRAGVSQFNIRNLGFGSTLTLINGRRAGVAATADDTGTDFLDINQFPLAMIERIEVLTDGASATYGSQAVAGVANIITRKGFEGFEVSGGYSSASIDAWHLDLAAGSNFDTGSFNVYATYYEQGHNERSEFDWMVDRLIGQGDISRSRFLSSTGSPGTYRRATIDPATNEATDVAGADNTPDADCEAAGGVFRNPADVTSPDDRCRYHFVDQVSVISAEERAQVFAEFDWQVSEGVTFYNESSFSNNIIRRDSGGGTFNTGRADGGGFTISGDHPFNFYINDPVNPEALIWIGPAAWDPAIHTGATLRAIARPLGADVNNNELTSRSHREFNYTRIMNGLEIDLPGNWFVDFSYGWAKSSLQSNFPHNYRSNVFQDLVRSGEWNPFGTRISDPGLVSPKDAAMTTKCAEARGGVCTASNPQVTQTKFDQRSVSNSRVLEKVADVIASGEVFDTGMGTISAAVGVQFRDTLYESIPDSLEAAGEANEESTESSVRGRQDVLAFFGEVIVPFNDLAELQLAVRNEDYGSGVSTTDPKLSLSLDATDWLAFRGSWGTSFQAPTIRQTAEASSSAFLDDPASPTGPGGSTVCVDTGLSNNVAVFVLGAPDLQPQESTNFNIGAIFQTERFRASIDYWNFDYTDLIAQSEGVQAIVDNDCKDDGIPNDPRVIRDAGGQLRQVNTKFTNIGSVETDGIDINADYNMDIGSGSLSIDFGATFVNKFDVDVDGDGTLEFDGAGSRNNSNNFSTMPEVRARLGGTYLIGNHTANITARYVDGYKNDQSNDADIDSWTVIDAQYSFVMPGLIGDGDTTFTIGANNVFDEDPPALFRNNTDGTPRTRFESDGTYDRSWIDRPGYDDRAGHDVRGRIVYVRFMHQF